MDNVVAVAVIDTLENLLHQDRSVFLSELSSRDNLIKELSTFTDPINSLVIMIGHLLCNNVVSLFVLEELIHLDNVWMVL